MSGYADLALLKFHLSASSDGVATFTDADTILLQRCLDAASGMIDRFTGRTFRAENGAVKYFTATCHSSLSLSPDLRAVTEVAIDTDGDLGYGTVLAASDYWLCPAQSYPDAGIYSEIAIAPRSSQAFAPGYRVRVTGNWGYVVDGEAPSAVIEACLLQAARLYNRRGAPFGILQTVDLGQFTRISKADPDVQALLMPYRAARSLGAGVY